VPEANIIDTTPLPIPFPILHGFSHLRIGQAMRIFAQSIDINSRMVAELRLKIERPDIIIRPDVVRFGMFESVDTDVLMEIGKAAVMSQLDELRKAVSWQNKIGRLLRRITPVNMPVVLKQEPDSKPSSGSLEID